MLSVQKAAVVGHPIEHTMSPFLQERLFRLQNMPMEYWVLDLPDLSQGLAQLRGLDCFNVTIPHKSAVVPYLDEMTEKARVCGSVNTVRVRDGKLFGTTTDGDGCVKALRRHGLDLTGSVLLLGTGGAARALAFETVSRQDRVRLTIACRKASYKKGMALGDELAAYIRSKGKRGFRIVVETYEELETAAKYLDPDFGYDLLLNATSVGMVPNVGQSPVSQAVILGCRAVFDAVYNPGETELLRLAAQCGVKTVPGIEMLVYQAVSAFEFWYGMTFREEDIDALCRDAMLELEMRSGRPE